MLLIEPTIIEPTIIETTDSAGANVEKTGPLGHLDWMPGRPWRFRMRYFEDLLLRDSSAGDATAG